MSFLEPVTIDKAVIIPDLFLYMNCEVLVEHVFEKEMVCKIVGYNPFNKAFAKYILTKNDKPLPEVEYQFIISVKPILYPNYDLSTETVLTILNNNYPKNKIVIKEYNEHHIKYDLILKSKVKACYVEFPIYPLTYEALQYFLYKRIDLKKLVQRKLAINRNHFFKQNT